jgi:hypothetical protein
MESSSCTATDTPSHSSTLLLCEEKRGGLCRQAGGCIGRMKQKYLGNGMKGSNRELNGDYF